MKATTIQMDCCVARSTIVTIGDTIKHFFRYVPIIEKRATLTKCYCRVCSVGLMSTPPYVYLYKTTQDKIYII